MEHDEFCNCEDCWWARGEREVCATCGCVHEPNVCEEEYNREEDPNFYDGFYPSADYYESDYGLNSQE